MIQQTLKNKISFYTFGCRLNQSETAVIQNSLLQSGYAVVNFGQEADIVVVNTCTVTENGDADTRRLVNKIVRTQPNAKIALVGCQAQMQKEKLAELPNIGWVIGNAKKFELAKIFSTPGVENFPQVITPAISRNAFEIPAAGIDRGRTRANIKIQDGCDFFCTFCEIPYARGRARSRIFSNILDEVRSLVDAGHQEIILTGINIGTYQADEKKISDVIAALENIEGLKRIRISSIEPTTIPDIILEKMAAGSKLCRYLHIPLQSGSNEILAKMRRKYTAEEFTRFITNARSRVAGICIGTDVIVGFPGEREEHFQETFDLLRELPIDYFHVFSYSKRTMAKSKDLPDAIPQKVIEQRSEILRELSRRKRRVLNENALGKTAAVLFENEKKGYWTGLTDNYIRVYTASGFNLKNQIRPVKLLGIRENTVYGELI